jgi:hypothetical protein
MSNPFSPTQIRFGGHGNDDKNGVWVRLWLGPEGSPSVISSVADLNSGSPDLWRSLGKVGVLVSHADRKQIIDKIPSFPGRYAFRVVNSLGWSLGYVTANTVFGAPGAIVERQFGDLNLKKYRSSGTLAEWQQQVLPLCTGNSRLMFAILCAFAGPLLEILSIGSFGFQLFGPSSIGKTIVLIVGGSAWGCRVGASAHQGFCEKWATTLEAVERLGRVHNDGFGVIDDTRLVGNDRDIGKLIAPFIMRLHEGVAKNRAVAIDAGGDWRLVYLGSSNPPLAQIFAAADLEFDDAYRVRFPDIPGDAGCAFSSISTATRTPPSSARNCTAGRPRISVRPANATWSGSPTIDASAGIGCAPNSSIKSHGTATASPPLLAQMAVLAIISRRFSPPECWPGIMELMAGVLKRLPGRCGAVSARISNGPAAISASSTR